MHVNTSTLPARTAFLILGAGPTGLGAARQLVRLGVSEWVLAEQSLHTGGLASSFVDAHGFTWDVGGHVQHSHYQYFDDAMDEFLGRDGWLEHEREAWIWMRDRFIPYPIQQNLHLLPEDDLLACLQGLVEITRNLIRTARNFGEWMTATFGTGIGKVFLRPYNQKVWAHPPEHMTHTWVGDRVAPTDLFAVLQSLVRRRTNTTWGPNRHFRYPRSGSTGSVWTAAASRLPSQKSFYGRTLRRIDPSRHYAEFDSGEASQYGHLISTIPVTGLLTGCDTTGSATARHV